MTYSTLSIAVWILVIATFTARESCAEVFAKPSYQGASEPVTPLRIYGQDVRETPWRSPEEEAAGFHLPPGFVAELVASEPDIAKPLNMAFDHRGRLWITCSLEYPYPVPEGTQGRDTIKILEDTTGDGRFDTVKTFATGLNIPIGILPVEDGAICFSIPNIWRLRDTDGDDQEDERIKLLGPFDTTRDTHGMINALRMGLDGWVYACHGFSNQSNVAASDGSRVQLNSGNTFRFRPDGSRIESYTQGQVNPFGMTCDQWGNWYTADCHSKPLTALLAGACYPSFGRPHDGLGFAPSMMEHLHGSTAICGLEYYQAQQFPPAYRHLFYSGNVMTCRINCNAPNRTGMTVTATELADFMTSDDPWFRPVDLRVGPDGCLYVADFYNGIIGHYEVPLDHPGRDRHSGRIWRIRYVGTDSIEKYRNDGQLQADPNQHDRIANDLASTNFYRRQQAVETELSQRTRAEEQLATWAIDSLLPVEQRLSAIEILARRGQLTGRLLLQLLEKGPDEIQVLVLKIACGWPEAEYLDRQVLVRASELLNHEQPEVVKAVFELLGRTGDSQYVPRLVEAAINTNSSDPVRLMAARIAIRNILQRDEAAIRELEGRWSEDPDWAHSSQARLLVNIMPAIASPIAAKVMLRFLSSAPDDVGSSFTSATIEHAARNPSSELLDLLLDVVRRATEGDTLARVNHLCQIADKFQISQSNAPRQFQTLAQDAFTGLVRQLEDRLKSDGPTMVWLDGSGNPWGREVRTCRDGEKVELISSLSKGETYTGILTSEPFACPKQLTFWLAGHNGFPDQSDHHRNRVRLVNYPAGQVISEAFPPRSDVADQVVWELDDYSGQQVQVQIVDGDNGGAFAWLAIGRFSEPGLQLDSNREILDAIHELARRGMGSLSIGESAIDDKMLTLPLSQRQRAKFIVALLEGRGRTLDTLLARHALALGRSEMVSFDLLETSEDGLEKSRRLVEELSRMSTGAQQTVLARELLKSVDGCELLAEVLDTGLMSPGSLRGLSALVPDSVSPHRKEQLNKFVLAAQQAGLDTSLVAHRLAELNWQLADQQRGRELFTQHCANCHQLAGEGAIIGPQLDGAIHRGIERLAEDILLPNINVDRAFRVSTLLMDDGSIVSGQILGEDHENIQLVGADAKPVVLKVEEVVDRRQSEQSLMPSNFSELLSDQHLADLLHFLTHSTTERPGS